MLFLSFQLPTKTCLPTLDVIHVISRGCPIFVSAVLYVLVVGVVPMQPRLVPVLRMYWSDEKVSGTQVGREMEFGLAVHFL